jgi:hypothetical protein
VRIAGNRSAIVCALPASAVTDFRYASQSIVRRLMELRCAMSMMLFRYALAAAEGPPVDAGADGWVGEAEFEPHDATQHNASASARRFIGVAV